MNYTAGTFSAEERELVITPPQVSDVDVKLLMAQIYGLEVIDMHRLDGYYDLNYHVTVQNRQASFVLKMLNSYDSKADQFQDAHVKMMIHLRDGGICCPRIVRNLHHTDYSKEIITKTIDGETVSLGPYWVMLTIFESGTVLKSVNYGQDLLYQMGQLVGDLHIRLKNFRHPGLMEYCMPMFWQCDHFLEISNMAPCVKGSERQALVEGVIATFREQKEIIDQLPKGPLHADVSDTNVLIKKDHESFKISCLLDFGVSHYGALVYDVATSIMYAMLQRSSVKGKTLDPHEVGAHVIAGYLSRRKLEAEEFSAIRILVAIRFTMSLVTGAYRAQLEPDNKDYLLATSNRGWEVFLNFWNTPEKSIRRIWRIDE